MNKKIKYLIMVILIFSLTSCVSFALNNEKSLNRINNDGASISAEQYSKLLRYYSGKDEFSDTSIEYPDYYAGAYVDDDMKLNVNVTYLNEDIKAELYKATENEDLLINVVNYSFSDLMKTCSKVENFIDNNKVTVSGGMVFGVGLSIKENAVNIYALSDETIFDSSLECLLDDGDAPVKIIYRDSLDSNASLVYPGSGITNTVFITTYTRSVGFWGYDSNGNIGFVTSPHDSMSYNETVSIGGNTFGTCETPYYSGSTDAVFVKRSNSSFSPSNYISQWNTSIISHSYQSLPEGEWIRARGVNTSTTGRVLDTHYTTSYGISDTVLTSGVVSAGDSGGVVVGPDATTGKSFLVGIVTGRIIADGSMIYVKAYNIFTNLGLSINNSPY